MSSASIRARSLDHVGLTVPNMDEASRFFEQVLGAQWLFDSGPFESGDDWMQIHLGVNPRSRIRTLRMMRLPEGGMLELFAYEAPGQQTVWPANSDVGGYHVAFRVGDMDASVTRLRELGIQVMGEPKRISDGPAAGLQWVYFKAPWGAQLELVSYSSPWPAPPTPRAGTSS